MTSRHDAWQSRGAGEAPVIKTRAEQRLEWLFQMSRHRKLTNDEWEEVRRCERAIYQRMWRLERAAAQKDRAA